MHNMTIGLTIFVGLLSFTLTGIAGSSWSPVGTANAAIRRDVSKDAVSAGDLELRIATKNKIDSQTRSLSNDPYIEKQWALDRIHIPATWKIKPTNDVAVAILDTGINAYHEDLAGAVISSVNLTSSATTEDVFGHGTHIAGIIAGRTNNGAGIAGVDQNVKLLNVKIADDNGNGSSVNIANGIIWAADHGANVINVSLVTIGPSTELESAVDYAWRRGAVVIAAVGNGIQPAKCYPALYKNCIAVVGINDKDQVGTGLVGKEAIAAPGYNIFSTLPGNKYGYRSGSSMAAAYVSAAAALAFSTAKSSNENMNDLVREQIWKSTDHISSGLLNYSYINFEKLAASLLQ